MPLPTLPEAVLYQGQGDKGEECQDFVIKNENFAN